MLKIIESPQFSSHKISYTIDGDVLTITLDEVKEVFDFTDLPQGQLESVEVDTLLLNPILSAEKVNDVVTINLLRFYGPDEKEVFENGEN